MTRLSKSERNGCLFGVTVSALGHPSTLAGSLTITWSVTNVLKSSVGNSETSFVGKDAGWVSFRLCTVTRLTNRAGTATGATVRCPSSQRMLGDGLKQMVANHQFDGDRRHALLGNRRIRKLSKVRSLPPVRTRTGFPWFGRWLGTAPEKPAMLDASFPSIPRPAGVVSDRLASTVRRTPPGAKRS